MSYLQNLVEGINSGDFELEDYYWAGMPQKKTSRSSELVYENCKIDMNKFVASYGQNT